MSWLKITLSFLLVCESFTSAAWAQNEAPLPTRLTIVVLQGEGAINQVRQRSPHQPMVRVEDENQKSIAGAAVAFTLPISGASGEFSNGSKNLTVVTDGQGTAVAQGLKANQIAGNLPIHINVSYRGLTARTTVTQFNMAVPGKSTGGGGGKIAAIVAVLGAAAAGGAYAALHKSKTSPTTPPAPPAPPPIGLTPGTPTIVPPR